MKILHPFCSMLLFLSGAHCSSPTNNDYTMCVLMGKHIEFLPFHQSDIPIAELTGTDITSQKEAFQHICNMFKNDPDNKLLKFLLSVMTNKTDAEWFHFQPDEIGKDQPRYVFGKCNVYQGNI